MTGPAHTVTSEWEAHRDILDYKENKAGTTLVSKYDYLVNAIGQRSNVAQSGTAFASSRDIAWGYDSLGQVTSADSTIPGLDRAYQFDLIGNRLKTADSLTLPVANNYTPNALNQYTAIDTLNPVHDDDGNMTAGPLPANITANSTLTWDGENRLISATVPGGNTVTFIYDSQSRRIAETVGTVTKITVYDGWNPIAEYSISNNQYSISKTYLWGMDLSGTLQGAGGVGGLLAVTDSTGTYYPTYDGNGNISEYLDSTGTIVAHYEYDPFGKTTVATGPKANDFAHRFSTKPLDATTGLYYYGYRYYDPATGRWPSRDLIGEMGGINLYGFVGNDGVNGWDRLGMLNGNIGVGVGGEATLILPSVIGSFGLSGSYQTTFHIFFNGGALPSDCGLCSTMTITALYGAGAAVSAGIYVSLSAGPANNAGTLDGFSISVGGDAAVGGSFPGTPTNFGVALDHDLMTAQTTLDIDIPALSVGFNAYAALKISGNLTACSTNKNIHMNRAERLAKMWSYLRDTKSTIENANKQFNNRFFSKKTGKQSISEGGKVIDDDSDWLE